MFMHGGQEQLCICLGIRNSCYVYAWGTGTVGVIEYSALWLVYEVVLGHFQLTVVPKCSI